MKEYSMKGWRSHNIKVWNCDKCDNGEWFQGCEPRCICEVPK